MFTFVKNETMLKIAYTLVIGLILIAVLPASPFTNIVDAMGATPYLGYLNWFIPVGKCLTVMTLWLSAVTIYYWIKWALVQLGLDN